VIKWDSSVFVEKCTQKYFTEVDLLYSQPMTKLVYKRLCPEFIPIEHMRFYTLKNFYW